ncbi:MAG: hypothetical protein HY402_05145 [Elusimicrobia bacterium]|nr:hypothetical protein [Elusimicrobiota bacterium]
MTVRRGWLLALGLALVAAWWARQVWERGARPAGPDYGRGVPAQHAFGARPVEESLPPVPVAPLESPGSPAWVRPLQISPEKKSRRAQFLSPDSRLPIVPPQRVRSVRKVGAGSSSVRKGYALPQVDLEKEVSPEIQP